MPELTIRNATPDDVPLILRFIHALADYEKLAHEVVTDETELHARLFSATPQAEVVIAEWQSAPAGFALFFHNFSTFRGKRGLYLEDLFVQPEYRGKGIGKALLQRLAGIALQRDCARFEWAVLDWNQPARDFYESLGAECMMDWRIYRVTGDALSKLAIPD